jgi:hypothetical protein
MKMKRFILLLLFFSTLYNTSASNFKSITDTSSNHLEKLINKYQYFFFQYKNPNLPELKKNKYKSQLNVLGKEIFKANQEKSKVKLDSTRVISDMILLFTESSPVYAHEINSILLNLACSFAGPSYFPPVIFSAEKVTSGKISLGGYLGYFTEHKKASDANIESGGSFVFTKQSYKYNYLGAGIKASCHLLNISPFNMNMNSTIYDVYSSLSLGYNFAFLKTILPNSIVPFEPPRNKGINVGLMLGVNYYPDDNFKLFCEAGYSRMGYISAGVGYRILPSQ